MNVSNSQAFSLARYTAHACAELWFVSFLFAFSVRREKATRTIWEFNIAQEQAFGRARCARSRWSLEREAILCGLPRFAVWHKKVHAPVSCHSWCSRERVARLEQAIAAIGNFQGPDVGHFIEESTEGCSGDAVGSTDPSSSSFHRTVQEEDRTIRRRACSRSPEVGGESERLEELRAVVLVQPSRTTAFRCQCRSDNDNCRAQLHHWSSLHFEVGRGGLRSRHGGGGLGVVGRQEDMNTAVMDGNLVEAAAMD